VGRAGSEDPAATKSVKRHLIATKIALLAAQTTTSAPQEEPRHYVFVQDDA
jgi:hypothetical protein